MRKTQLNTKANRPQITRRLITQVFACVVLVALCLVVGQACSGGFIAMSLTTTTALSSSGLSSTGSDNTGSPILASSSQAPSANVPAGYHLTFDDEFTSLSASDSPNPSAKWFTTTVQCCMSDTDHPSTPTYMGVLSSGPNPFSITSQGLDIRLQKVATGWYGGALSTADSQGNGFSQQYGYFEMKAKFPSAPGTWPGFWLNSTAHLKNFSVNAGEIDIMEHYGQFPSAWNITLHDWSPNAAVLPYSVVDTSVDTSADFHLYGMLWTATTMMFYFDNKIVFTTPTPDIMKQPYYVIIDLGLGGGWPTANTPAQNDMIIQYVRVYSM